MSMNVLVLGSGGREHALCQRIARSPLLDKLFILPGNGGTESLGTNVPGSADDVALALEVARREQIDLTVVGPEAPLAAGIVDAFEEAGLRIFGPSAAAARIESDKAFAKKMMRQYAVPTGEARVFEDFELARQYIATRDEPVVVKAAGLAQGKGVIVCDDPSDALIAAENMLVHRQFGDAGAKIVVEDRLLGREASVLAIVDRHTSYVLEPAQDHKRLKDNDAGPNTGGMGAYCPTPAIDESTMQQIEQQILVPMLDGFVRERMKFRGVLYIGLMLTAAGPRVLEFNCRFGDPEAQCILLRMQSDLLELLDATVSGKLEDANVVWDSRHALCVVMAAPGYPGEYPRGVPIGNIPEDTDDVVVFHAGTKRMGRQVVSTGGRVLGVTALGQTLADARQRAYGIVEQINFAGAQYRTDIGYSAGGE